MKNSRIAIVGFVLVSAVTILEACSASQNAQLATDAAAVQATVAAAKPVVNSAACAAQAATNTATDLLAATGNSGDAATSASASKLLGLLCYTTASAAPVTP